MSVKANYRKLMKKRLNQMNEHTYKKWSAIISNRLFSEKCWSEANTIGLTISIGKEVETKQIIQLAWEEGKQVVIPRTIWKTKEMEFRQINHFNELQENSYGLFEPHLDKTNPIKPENIDLLIVPGLCFDIRGYRIGYGGGFYDRFLKSFEGHTLSLAFDFQCITWVPTEKYDLPVKQIITNERNMLTNVY
jgi:5-formyltetrahydrofolate cyclo-ligase